MLCVYPMHYGDMDECKHDIYGGDEQFWSSNQRTRTGDYLEMCRHIHNLLCVGIRIVRLGQPDA
jgi:hypothetical protein